MIRRTVLRIWAKLYRKHSPVQLHDLFLVGMVYTENVDDVLTALDEGTAPADLRKTRGLLFPGFYDSGARYQDFLARLVGHFKLGTIVETGIAHGASTRVLLEALLQIVQSHPEIETHLHSIDVDERTRWPDLLANDMWSFHLANSRRDIDAILDDIGEIDLFIHDSNHGYRQQMKEYRAAWGKLRSGGFLVSDDVNWSNAFLDFCRSKSLCPVFLSEAPKVSGVLRKP